MDVLEVKRDAGDDPVIDVKTREQEVAADSRESHVSFFDEREN